MTSFLPRVLLSGSHRHHPHSSQQAFTLIELLIVVAIILILIAIALPNFLEAQIRARVAKTKSELNTLQTVWESYITDYKTYPMGRLLVPDGSGGLSPHPGAAPDGYGHNWGFIHPVLTTPVKYITSLFPDLFAEGYIVAGQIMNVDGNHPWALYRTSRRLRYEVTLERPYSASCSSKPRDSAQWCGNYDVQNPSYWTSKQYLVSSLGPDRDEDLIPQYIFTTSTYRPFDEFYSPTNGTISSGDIIETGP